VSGRKGHSGRRSTASLRAPLFGEVSVGDSGPGYTVHELYELLGKLYTHGEALPDELWRELRGLIEWHISQLPWTPGLIDMLRWFYVREGFERGHRVVDNSVYEYAAEKVTGTPAAGGAAAMKASYSKARRRCREVTGFVL
jgi:hypothetical protein